nr:hypothetical protein Itr_chr03CG10000 [Ipomoea trifida]
MEGASSSIQVLYEQRRRQPPPFRSLTDGGAGSLLCLDRQWTEEGITSYIQVEDGRGRRMQPCVLLYQGRQRWMQLFLTSYKSEEETWFLPPPLIII